MNDVIPTKDGWIGRCECGLSAHFARQEDAWQWLLDHPCRPQVPQIPQQARLPDAAPATLR